MDNGQHFVIFEEVVVNVDELNDFGVELFTSLGVIVKIPEFSELHRFILSLNIAFLLNSLFWLRVEVIAFLEVDLFGFVKEKLLLLQDDSLDVLSLKVMNLNDVLRHFFFFFV